MMSVQEGKKKKHGRINQEDVFVTNYSGDALGEKGDVLTKLGVSYHLLTGKPGHWRRPVDITMVQGWQQKASSLTWTSSNVQNLPQCFLPRQMVHGPLHCLG